MWAVPTKGGAGLLINAHLTRTGLNTRSHVCVMESYLGGEHNVKGRQRGTVWACTSGTGDGNTSSYNYARCFKFTNNYGLCVYIHVYNLSTIL